MIAEKYLGIWMDHASAHLIEFTSDLSTPGIIESKFTHQVKEDSLGKSENLMHNKEQHQESAWYNKLGDLIQNYTAVVLFGPTDAKLELFNVLKADHRFAKIRIETRQADKMTEGQQRAFVLEHFSRS